MLSKYTIHLTCQQRRTDLQWAYPLYAALLEHCPPTVGSLQHQGEPTGVSQFIRRTGEGWLEWQVSLLGEQAEDTFAPVLEGIKCYHLHREAVTLQVADWQVERIHNVEQLLTQSHPNRRTLHFVTPTAFKSRRHYDILPTPERILQSLLRRWNRCIPNCPIEDEDGGGVKMLAQDLHCCGLRLQAGSYTMKKQNLPGVLGTLTLENHLHGASRQIADGLLTFATFSGVGIKTTLGMGGIVET